VLTLGLTGGIGAGKSTAARRLCELGALVVDADQLARAVLAAGTPGLAEVVETFGPAVLAPSGELDRAALGRIVFADDAARRRLEEITHPRIAAATAEAFAIAPADAIGVHDVPLLVEKRMGAAYHLVLVVHADVEERVRRLVTQRGMSEDDARARIAAQATDGDRRAAADVWLDNTGVTDALVEAVDVLWHNRLRPFADNLAARRPAPAGERPAETADGVSRVIARLQRRLGDRAHRVEPAGEHTIEVQVAGRAELDAVRPELERAGYAWVGGASGPVFGQRYTSCDPGCGMDLSVVALTV